MLLAQTNANNAQTILQNGILSQQAIAQAMDQLWNQVMNSPVYESVALIGSLFAYATIALFVYQWAKTAQSDEGMTKAWEDWLLLAVVVLLLHNKGTFLREVIFGLRAILNHLSEQVLQSTLNGSQSLIDAFNQVSAMGSVQAWYNQALQTCQAITDPVARQTCLTQAQATANQMAQAGVPNNAPNSNIFQQLFQGATGLLTNGLEQVLIGWLIALGVAVQWLVEITWILTGLAGPIAVGGALLPVGQKSIYAWLIGFYSLGLYKLFFNILIGMVAMVQLTSNTLNSLIFAIATGLLSPILAAALTLGGGWATFTSLASVSGVVGGKIGMATGKAGVALGGKAAKGGTKLAGRGLKNASSTAQNAYRSYQRRIRKTGSP